MIRARFIVAIEFVLEAVKTPLLFVQKCLPHTRNNGTTQGQMTGIKVIQILNTPSHHTSDIASRKYKKPN